MASESTGLTAGLFAVTLVVAPSLGCDSGKFSDAPRAEAPDEPMVDRQKTRQKRRPNRREGQTEMPSNHPPVGGAQGEQDRGGSGQPPAPGGSASGGGLPIQWDVPEGWTETQPSSRMRETQFRLPGSGEAGPATMAVFHFGGQAGGGPIQANIDRWVKQFQGPEGKLGREAADISKKTVRGLNVHLVDIAGTYVGMGRSKPKQNQRMLGAIVEAGGGLVVFKLVGPKPTVSDHHEEFHQFVDSFRPTG